METTIVTVWKLDYVAYMHACRPLIDFDFQLSSIYAIPPKHSHRQRYQAAAERTSGAEKAIFIHIKMIFL